MAKRKFKVGDTVCYVYEKRRHKRFVLEVRQYYDGINKYILYLLEKEAVSATNLKTTRMVLTEKINNGFNF